VYYFTLLTGGEDRIRDAIRKHPEAPEAYVALGLHQLGSGQRREAAASFEEAWKRNSTDCRISSTCSDERDLAPGFDSISPPASAYDAFQRAKRLAESALGKLTELAPDSPLAAQARAHLWEQGGRLEQAEEQYRKAVELSRRDAASLVDYAKFLAKQGQLDRAPALLEEALRAEPSSPVIRALLGEVCVMKDQPSAALPHLKAALAARPNDEQTRTYLAQSLAKLERLPEATAVLEAAPSDPQGRLHYLLGTLYRRMGQQAKAERAFEIFRQRKPAR
jgi:Tfp pilus assembly protein PilF